MHERRSVTNDAAPTGESSRRAVLMGLGGVATAFTAAGWTIETRAQDASPSPGNQPVEEPNAIVQLFSHPTDVAAFEDYYLNTHVQLVAETMDNRGFEEILFGSSLVALEGGPAGYHRITTWRFASQAHLEAWLALPAAQAALADTANVATGGVTVFLASLTSLYQPSVPPVG
jgi:uncharacterized protein (TIGR02118 family)